MLFHRFYTESVSLCIFKGRLAHNYLPNQRKIVLRFILVCLHIFFLSLNRNFGSPQNSLQCQQQVVFALAHLVCTREACSSQYLCMLNHIKRMGSLMMVPFFAFVDFPFCVLSFLSWPTVDKCAASFESKSVAIAHSQSSQYSHQFF